MSAPNLTISVEPFESGKVVYLSLAPRAAGQARSGQLSLRLSIRNNENAPVHVSQLQISFVGTPAVSAVTIPMALDIAAGASARWFFSTAQNIILPLLAPSAIKLDLSCNGFNAPATLSLPLAAHHSPTTAGSYQFPARTSDLRKGEYWSGSSAGHSPAGDGGQAFAYDLGVMAFDPAKADWSSLLPGTAGDKNEHYRIWGKRVYAAADGTVVAFKDDMPSNTKMGKQDPTPNPVEGNHFYIQHGDELMLYAHFQPGSLNKALMQQGKQIKSGDFLGLAGNSGNSTNPHLHIHVIQATQPWGGPARPLPFQDLHVIDRTVLHPPDPAGAWVKTDDQGLPNTASALWPAATKPTWYPPGWALLARHGIPESAYQTEFDHIVSSGYRLVWLDGYDVNGSTFFNAIFHAVDGTPWAARHGLDGTQYQHEFDTMTQQGFRLMHIESYLSGGKVRYAPIFIKAPGPAWTAYHGCTATEHQQKFDSLTQQGFRPINISPVSPGGVRTYAGLYEKRDVGGFFVKSFLTPPDYQSQFDANVAAGRKLAYLAAYTHSGGPRISAIWQEKAGSPFVARHGLPSTAYQAEFDHWLGEGYLLRAVAGYEEHDEHRFAALWSK